MSRRLCPSCQRPESRCFCGYVCPIANQIEVLLLQHPDEHQHPKNTGELLARNLRSCRLHIAETLDSATAQTLLTPNTALLYPSLPKAATAETKQAVPERVERLVVLDATWRKSRKMLFLNPALAALPRVSLTETPNSLYRIRSAAKRNQLSTFEASCYALQQLEGDATLCQPALAAFTDYMNHLASFDPNRS